MVARALQFTFLLGLLAACSASPAAIISANNEAQSAVRELGIQSQIASRVSAQVAAPHRCGCGRHGDACGMLPPPTHSFCLHPLAAVLARAPCPVPGH